MNKAELESKHLAELHTLAAETGVERYRMLSRDELIEALADGPGGGGGGGGGSRGGRGGGSRGGRGGSGGGGSRESRGGREGSRGGRGGSRGGRGGSRGGRGESRGGRGEGQGRQPRQGDRAPDSRQSERAPKPEPREEAPAPPARSGDEGSRPRRRRRRRFGRGRKTVRIQDVLLPGSGGQVLVYSDSRAGCTTLLRELAAELSGGKGPDPVAVLVDPSPEELAEWKREAPKAEIVSAGQERHAEDALAQAVRRAEGGEDVIVLIDSLSRVAEEFGGAKSAKALFDAGLSASGSGSLTVVAALERGE